MDNITHGLTGVGIAIILNEAVGESLAGLTVSALLASQLPDLDVILGSRGKIAYIKHHRGFSHSLILAPFLAFFTAIGVKIFFFGDSFALLFLTALLSLLMHLFLDLLNAYGTRLLWPFNKKRFALDILMIVDPVIITVFLLSFFTYFYFKSTSLLYAVYPFLGLYILSMLQMRLKAKVFLEKKFINAIKLYILPPLLGCRKWNFVVLRNKKYYLGQVDVFSGKIDIKEELYLERECNLVTSSKKNADVQIFLEFARLPWFSRLQEDDEILIKWSDLRYRLREKEHFFLLTKPKR